MSARLIKLFACLAFLVAHPFFTVGPYIIRYGYTVEIAELFKISMVVGVINSVLAVWLVNIFFTKTFPKVLTRRLINYREASDIYTNVAEETTRTMVEVGLKNGRSFDVTAAASKYNFDLERLSKDLSLVLHNYGFGCEIQDTYATQRDMVGIHRYTEAKAKPVCVLTLLKKRRT